MIKFFSTALIAACALGVKITEGDSERPHEGEHCDWKKAIGYIAGELDTDGSGKVEVAELIAGLEQTASPEQAEAIQADLSALTEAHDGLTAQDFIDFLRGAVDAGEIEKKALVETVCAIKKQVRKQANKEAAQLAQAKAEYDSCGITEDWDSYLDNYDWDKFDWDLDYYWDDDYDWDYDYDWDWDYDWDYDWDNDWDDWYWAQTQSASKARK